MNEFSQRPDLQELIKLRRARQLATAIIKRAREAGIPERFMRINQQKFSSVLNPNFHGKQNIEKLTESIYKNQDFLMKRNFIAIDGGTPDSRDFAGFAILFRIIAYDKIGKYCGCKTLGHKFQTINATSEITRNDLADELKEYDVLFLGELHNKDFSPHFEAGSFLDEVIEERIHASKLTIITFSTPLITSIKDLEKAAGEGKLDCGYGERLARVSLTPQTTDTVLRIRVNAL